MYPDSLIFRSASLCLFRYTQSTVRRLSSSTLNRFKL